MTLIPKKTVAVIVAHPDDETLWAGGTILSHPAWGIFIVCLCRKNDKERSHRFISTLKIFKSEGIMGDLDDGPEQKPSAENVVEQVILDLIPARHFDLIITHNPGGEYTRHLRHEETGKAVIRLWNTGKISTNELWCFAYTDDNKKLYPVALENASIYRTLSNRIWLRKYSIITGTYGFEKTTFEAQTTPMAEAFWQFTDPRDAKKWSHHFKTMKTS